MKKSLQNITTAVIQKECAIFTDTTRHCMKNLKDEFNGEDAGEDVVEEVEDDVSSGFFEDRIFSGERNAASTDDDHDEQIKVAEVDDEMTEPTNSARRRDQQPNY